jgi:dipeptidyl aminopeptidase/acylaminoacyl peptidase
MTFSSLDTFVRTPRITSLALSPDGTRLVATVQEPDAKLAKYVTALWEIDPDGLAEPRRLTFAEQGESAPTFTPDGELLFVSSRPDPQDGDNAEEADTAALWVLPQSGEPSRRAILPGGVGSPQVSNSGAIVVTGSRLVGSTDTDDDRSRRKARKEHGVTAILHDGMPVRFWDHELDDTEAHLFIIESTAGSTDVRLLTPGVGQRLRNTDFDLADDGQTVLVRLIERTQRGSSHSVIARINVTTAAREVILDEPNVDASQPRLSPDGSRFVVGMHTQGRYDNPHDEWLEIADAMAPERRIRLRLGDLDWSDTAWSPDGSTLYVTGDLHGRGEILAVDASTGDTRTVADDAVYTNVLPTPDGTGLFALRASMESPATPVRIGLSTGLEARGGTDPSLQTGDSSHRTAVTVLRSPGAVGELPGTMRRVSAQVDGVEVPGWLFLPEREADQDGGAPEPVPLMVWIHGGPFSSWNAWSWRWSPWLAVERGYAVLLPDPALSTGYGKEWIERAWPHRAGVVWNEVEGLLDAVLGDSENNLDGTRTALLGASFGGYMTNWIAGHTDRFRAIVTHAGLWSLDQQHDTTDAAENKNAIFGLESEHPDWYADNSPDRSAGSIVTPMLLIHGNRDYRVPISEALGAWWDLVSGFGGDPTEMPHRFLQLTGENHWVTTPSNARVWNETVFAFCDQHLRGGEPLGDRLRF